MKKEGCLRSVPQERMRPAKVRMLALTAPYELFGRLALASKIQPAKNLFHRNLQRNTC